MRVEKTTKAICENLEPVGAGALDSLVNNFTFGSVETIGKNKEVYGDDNRYYVGRLVADSAGIYLGVEGIVLGVGTEILGGALDLTGAGAPIGIQLNVAGIGIITGSATVVVNSGANFFQDAKDLSSNIEKGNSNNSDISSWIKDNRVPLDKETILSTFKKTKNRVKGATVYEKSGKFYHRDTLHKGERAHLEVYDKKGKHLGEADPVTGEIIPNTADSTKRLPK
ncbi:TPA_asm: hypothetical protein GHG54_02600 [Listeria monocytogenes]|nr:hypothetical protein [Listeria monocytogenes]